MECKQRPDGPLEMFVIYDHPRDLPGHFVVRRWLGDKPTLDFAIANTLESARTHVPAGTYRIPHQPAHALDLAVPVMRRSVPTAQERKIVGAHAADERTVGREPHDVADGVGGHGAPNKRE